MALNFAKVGWDDIELNRIPVIVLTTSNEDRDKVEACRCSWIYSQTCYILELWKQWQH